jgi:hypothetical protein
MTPSRFTVGLIAVLVVLSAVWYFSPQSLPAWLTRTIPLHATSNPPLYKWRDAKGRLHVTDQPPADRPYETVQYDPNANVVPGATPEK